MNKFTGNPVVTAKLVAGTDSYDIEVGTSISSVTVEHPYEDVVYTDATVVGLSLARRPGINNTGKILDGIPTKWYQTDDVANIHNAAEYFVVDKIEVTTGADDTLEYHVIPVDAIKEITVGGASGSAAKASVAPKAATTTPTVAPKTPEVAK